MARKNRAPQGSGTIRKKTVTRNGKTYSFWEARLTVGTDPGTGKQIQRSFSGKTQKAVREKMQAAAVERNDGTYQAPCKMTVSQWLKIWLSEYLGSVKPRTVTEYTSNVDNYLIPALGAIKLEALNTHSIQRLYNDLLKGSEKKAGLSAKTVRNIHCTLHKALGKAVALGYIRFNPSDTCELPRVEKKEIRPLDDKAIGDFLRVIRGHRFEDVYLVTLFTGMRQGEVCGLTWDSVSFDSGTILINKQLQKIPGQRGAYHLVPTKNSKWRTITPAGSVMETLRRRKAQQAQQRLQAGELWENSGFVFTNELGHHLSPHTVYHQFKTLAAAIGLPEARFHDLRHSYAVAAMRNGDPVKTVQENLGHHSAAFTLDIYGHVTDTMKKESADRMEQYIHAVSSL